MTSAIRFMVSGLVAMALVLPFAGDLSAQNLVQSCDLYLQQAETCLRETDQLNEGKKEALKNARAYFTILSGGEDDPGPRKRLGEQCSQMSKQLSELRLVRSKSCTL